MHKLCYKIFYNPTPENLYHNTGIYTTPIHTSSLCFELHIFSYKIDYRISYLEHTYQLLSFSCNMHTFCLASHCCRSKFLSKLLKTFDKSFREIFPVFISTKRREKPSAFFDNNFVNNAYFSEAASSSSSHLASSSSKAPISSRMTCLCLWSS